MASPVFAEVNGNSVQAYIAITITNSESSATPSPFQQMITVDSDSYSSYLASNLQNVNFQDGSGNIIDSWLESGNSNTDTSTIYWISLADGIAASSSVTVYYCVYSTSVNCFNTTNTGEAPQLSGSFGSSDFAEYDNGANVFISYSYATGTVGSSYSNAGEPQVPSLTSPSTPPFIADILLNPLPSVEDDVSYGPSGSLSSTNVSIVGSLRGDG